MSGHSKWANIKNRKGAQDKKRSEAFTKMAKNILTAVRLGGGNTNPDTNNHLKSAIDKAREVNMPKDNIVRLLEAFELRKANLVNYLFEGFGPFGVPFLVAVETDNKNRALGEIKLIFKNSEGNLGEEGCVKFMFEKRGEVEVVNNDSSKELELIDAGAWEIDGNIIWTKPEDLNEFSQKVRGMGMEIKRSELVMKGKTAVVLHSEDEVAKVLDLVDELEECDEVINVYTGFDFKG